MTSTLNGDAYLVPLWSFKNKCVNFLKNIWLEIRTPAFYAVPAGRVCHLVCGYQAAATPTHPGTQGCSSVQPQSRVVRKYCLIMKSFLICFLLFSVVYGSELSLRDTSKDRSTEVNVTESERENIETVSIDVQRVQVDRDQNGGFEDARILKVCSFRFILRLGFRSSKHLFGTQREASEVILWRLCRTNRDLVWSLVKF